MADLLKRSLAPLTDAAWEEIDDAATDVLRSQLTARTLVDFSGPHGWEYAAVNLGRLDIPGGAGSQDVPWGIRSVLPLIEVRVPFTMPQFELDNVSRGAKDLDTEPVEDVARRVALFEESAVYNGFEPGGIQGILPSAEHKPVNLPENPDGYPKAVAQALRQLREAGVPGPYSLVLGLDAYAKLMQSGTGGYPPHRIVADMIDGKVLTSRALEGGVLLSTADGNMEMVVGQDLSIGYAAHNRDEVELFLTESFTFRVLHGDVVVPLQ